MAICSKCGKQVPDRARFCSGCGSPMEQKPEAPVKEKPEFQEFPTAKQEDFPIEETENEYFPDQKKARKRIITAICLVLSLVVVGIAGIAMYFVLVPAGSGDMQEDSRMGYGCQELRIRVPDTFEDISDTQEAAAYAFALRDGDRAIFGTRESFDVLNSGESVTAEEYARQLLEANGLDSKLYDGKDFVYFTFTSGENAYFASVHQGADAIWVIQQANMPLEEAVEIAGTVTLTRR